VKTSKNLLEYIAFPASLMIVIWMIVSIIGRDFPSVGHDYRYFTSHMLDTHLHHLVNGPAIQWYTPSFGSGLPAYPNPQHIQYSIPQILMMVTNPWNALVISIILYSTAGVVCYYYFLRTVVELNWMSSTLGAIFIIANGFFIEHMIVGHVGFQHFPLLGVFLLAIFSKKLSILQASVIVGITGALMLNQAGFYPAVIFALSLLITLPLLYLLRPSAFQWPKFVWICLTGGMIVLLLSASKLSAIFSFMRFFPREIEDVYGITYIQGLKGMMMQLLGCMIYVPLNLSMGRNLDGLTPFFQQMTGSGYSLWETDISLSPAVFPMLLAGIASMVLQPLNKRVFFSKANIFAGIILLLGIWTAADYSLAQGWIFQGTKTLPVIRSLHVNVRFPSAFIFPTSLLAAYSFHTFFSRQIPINATIAFLFLSSLTILALSSYLLIGSAVHLRNFDIRPTLAIYDQTENGSIFPVRRILNMADDRVFKNRASNLEGLLEIIFGYSQESFHPLTETGSVYKTTDGYYNMTNPASYVFPKENNLSPFERFRVDQRQELDVFVNRSQPKFMISMTQRIANLCSLVALFGVFLYVSFQALLIARNSLKSKISI